MPTVVITGAVGNVGRKLRAHLEARGGYALRLFDIAAGDDPAVRKADFSTPDPAWESAFAGADVVVHLAAAASAGADWKALTGPNVDGVLNVYLAAARQGVRHVVLASSVWAMRGCADPQIAASDPDPGGNAYGASKLFAERVALAFWRSHGISTVAIRLGGCRPGDNPPAPGPDRWEEEVWASNGDTCRGFEQAINAAVEGVAVINIVSDNEGGRWSLDEAARSIGYHPQDHGVMSHPLTPPKVSRLRRIARRLLGRD